MSDLYAYEPDPLFDKLIDGIDPGDLTLVERPPVLIERQALQKITMFSGQLHVHDGLVTVSQQGHFMERYRRPDVPAPEARGRGEPQKYFSPVALRERAVLPIGTPLEHLLMRPAGVNPASDLSMIRDIQVIPYAVVVIDHDPCCSMWAQNTVELAEDLCDVRHVMQHTGAVYEVDRMVLKWDAL